MNSWQKKLERAVVKCLRSKKGDEETLIELGRKGFELSAVQYSYYRKVAKMKLKNRR